MQCAFNTPILQTELSITVQFTEYCANNRSPAASDFRQLKSTPSTAPWKLLLRQTERNYRSLISPSPPQESTRASSKSPAVVQARKSFLSRRIARERDATQYPRVRAFAFGDDRTPPTRREASGASRGHKWGGAALRSGISSRDVVTFASIRSDGATNGGA